MYRAGTVRWLFLSVHVTRGTPAVLRHGGNGDKAAASPNYRIMCKSSAVFLSPRFQLSGVLYSSGSDALEAYSALFLLISGIRAVSGNPG